MSIQAGDVFLSHDKGLVAGIIHLCESAKYGRAKGPNDPAWWNHTGMALSSDTLIESIAAGVVVSPTSKYTDNVRWLRPPYASGGIEQAAAITEMESMVGEPYADTVIISDAVYLLFKTTLRVGFANKHTCSGAVAHALTRAGFDMGDDEEWDSPADIFNAAVASKWTEVAP